MKITVLLLLLFAIGFGGIAQITLQPLLPQVGAFQKSQLWNVIAINTSSSTPNCYLVLSLQDRISGVEVMSATSATFLSNKGAKQLNVANLTPIQYSYFSFSGNNTDDFLPVGNYMACYKLMSGETPKVIEEICNPFDVEPLSPPILIMPTDSSVLQVQPAQFIWQPPAPLTMFKQLHYELMIAEILPGQKPEEAIELNAPFFMDLNVTANFMNYIGANPSFEREKWYAWQVVAKDGNNYAAKTEVRDFRMDSISHFRTTLEQTPFIKMEKNRPSKGVAPNNILKLSYINETRDSTAIVQIIDISTPDRNVHQFEVALKPGENLIQYNLKNLMTVEIGKVYLAQIINSRKEKWLIQFEVYNYTNKK